MTLILRGIAKSLVCFGAEGVGTGVADGRGRIGLRVMEDGVSIVDNGDLFW